MTTHKTAHLHFVGFKGDEYWRAVRVFGPPDFIHRHNDPRLRDGGEVGEDDIVVFANGREGRPHRFSFNDSEVF